MTNTGSTGDLPPKYTEWLCCQLTLLGTRNPLTCVARPIHNKADMLRPLGHKLLALNTAIY